MSRPSVRVSKVTPSLISIDVPDDRIRSLITDIAVRLANSDEAIQYAVRIAKEQEQGAVSDDAYHRFASSVGIFGRVSFSLWRTEALPFADDLCEALHGEDTFEPVPAVLQTGTVTK